MIFLLNSAASGRWNESWRMFREISQDTIFAELANQAERHLSLNLYPSIHLKYISYYNIYLYLINLQGLRKIVKFESTRLQIF